MTAQQLIETALFLSPEKLKNRPAEALHDALAFTEALRILEGSPAPNQSVARPQRPRQEQPPSTKHSDNSNPIDRLRSFREQSGMSTATIAKALGVNTGTLYFWLSGRYAPRQRSLDKIVSFLKKQ
jgi:DNA-binding transcriptional regulator YiaG